MRTLQIYLMCLKFQENTLCNTLEIIWLLYGFKVWFEKSHLWVQKFFPQIIVYCCFVWLLVFLSFFFSLFRLKLWIQYCNKILNSFLWNCFLLSSSSSILFSLIQAWTWTFTTFWNMGWYVYAWRWLCVVPAFIYYRR